ncbi:MAG: 2-amino-4-hydroxy-6-hydroxymethyldihydropteridine diphosphokinase [Chloroherpetonaceae bacterium]
MSIVFVGLGSNLGERLTMLQEAIACISELPTTEVLATSSVYESPPIDCSEQNPFLNAVCKITTDLSPTALLTALKDIERKLGRPERYARWSPRRIDLDILFYDDQVLQQDGLTIPHSEIQHRKFVLVPMLELEDVLHPLLKKRLSTLLAETSDCSVIYKQEARLFYNKKP